MEGNKRSTGLEIDPGTAESWCGGKRCLTSACRGNVVGCSCTIKASNAAKVKRKMPEHHCRYSPKCVYASCSSIQNPDTTL